MKKPFFCLFLTLFLNANEINFKDYENLIKPLKANDIASLIEILSTQYLPVKINENLTLNLIKAQNNSVNGYFLIKNITKSKLKLDAKNELCSSDIFLSLLRKGLDFTGHFKENNKEKFTLLIGKNFCE